MPREQRSKKKKKFEILRTKRCLVREDKLYFSFWIYIFTYISID